MATATLHLKELIQDSQDYGSDDEHMVSRVFFDLEVDGVRHEGLYADVKQPVGSSFESDNLEVSKPVGYKGPFNYEAFRAVVEEYYRRLIGAQGRGIHIEGGANIRMSNNRIVTPELAQFEVQAVGGPW